MLKWKRIVSLLCASSIVLAAAPLPMFAADRSSDPLIVVDQNFNSGRGESDKTTLGALSFNAYGTEQYLNQYETTNRTEWLDKFVDQMDRIKSHAEDPEGDGILGWYDARYSHKQIKNGDFSITGASSSATELLSNPSFETDGNGDQVPDLWTLQGNAAKVRRSTVAGDAYSGNAGVTIESDGTNANRLTQTFSVTQGKRYLVEGFAGVQTEKSVGRIEVYNPATSSVIAQASIHHVGFERQNFHFTAPSTGTLTIRIGLYDYSLAGYKARFDLLSVKQVDDPPADSVVNGRFETANPSDSTLPQGWARWANSDSSNVYLSSGINHYYGGLKGLEIATDNSSWEIAEQTIGYSPSQKYLVSFWGRVSDTRYAGRVELYNETDSTVVATKSFNNNEWKQHVFQFTAPAAAGKTLKVRLYQSVWQTTGTLSYFDELSIVPVVQSYGAGWSSNVGLANAHVTNSTDVNPYGGRGIELIHNGTTAPRMSQDLINYKAGSTYEFSIYAKVSSGTTGKLSAYDATTGTALASKTFTGTSEFTLQTVRFTTPSAGHQVRMDVEIASSGSGSKLFALTAAGGPLYGNLYDEARVAYPMLRFANLVYADSGLQSAYGAKADAYRNFVADNLFHKYDSEWVQLTGTDGSDNGTGLYVFPAGFSTEWFATRSLPHNQYLAFARMLYQLYDATAGVPAYAIDRPLYLSRADDMARLYASKVRAHPLNASLSTDAYAWSYWDAIGSWDQGNPYTYVNEDLSHGGETLKSVFEAYRHGKVFTSSDMQKFARTLTDVMWNDSYTDPAISYYNSRQASVTTDRLNSIYMIYWSEFAEIDRTVADIASAVMDQAGEEVLNPLYTESQVAKWSKNKAVNNGFEVVSPTDSTLPVYWTRFNATSSNVYLDPSDSVLGTRSAAVKTNGTNWMAMEQRLEQYEPNTPYTVTFYGKTDGVVNARVEAYDYTTNTVLGTYSFGETTWTPHSFTFTTPSISTDNIRIRLYHTAYTTANAIAHFDEVRALPNLYQSSVPNSGFEVTDYYDNTLPRYWARGATTDAANADLDPSTKVSGANSVRLSTAADHDVQELSYAWRGFKPNGSYHLTVHAKTNGSLAGGRIKVIDINTGSVLVNLPITSTSWTAYTANFNAPADYQHLLKVVITHNDPTVVNGDLWADDLGIYLN